MHGLLLIIMMLFFCGESFAKTITGEPYSQYNIQARLDTQKHELVAHQLVEYTNKSSKPLTEVYFVLTANHSSEKNPYIHDIANDELFWDGWEQTSTKIHYVKDANGNPMTFTYEKAPPLFQKFSLDNILLKITLAGPLSPADKIILDMGFTTHFKQNKIGDEAYWQGIYSWRFGWNPVELSMENDTWFKEGFRMVPGYFRLTLEIPVNFEIGAGANIKTMVKENDVTKTWNFESTVPQISIPLTMGPGLRKVEARLDNIKIESLYRGDHQQVAQMVAKLSKEIIAYYQPRFGTYRYQNLVVAEVSAPLTAFASDGLILLAENLYRYKDMPIDGLFNRLLEYVLAHEIGHMWWGVGMPPDFATENWLSEAFANYLAYSYIEDKYGIERNLFEYDKPGIFPALLGYLIGDQSFRQQSEGAYLNVYRLGWDEEIAKDPRKIEYGNAIATRTYEKGFWVLRALENEMGRDKLILALQTTFNRYQGQQLSIHQFQQVCEEILGEPLNWFFNQWVFGKEFIDYRINKVDSLKKGDTYQTKIEVSKTGNAIANTYVIAQTKDGKKINQTLDETQIKQTLHLNTQSEIIKVKLDPEQKVPDIYRLDNTWPRQIKYRFALYDNPLDAYSIRFNILPSSVYIPAKGTANGGLALGISGGYSPTHQWSVSSAAGFDKEKTYLSNSAAFDYRYSARNSLISMFNSTGYDANNLQQGVYTFLVGQQHTAFETPEIGFSSRYLLPSNIINNSLVLQNYNGWYQYKKYQQYSTENIGTMALWRLTYTRDDSLRYAWQNQLQLDLAPPAINEESFHKTSLTSIKQFRLIPNLILKVSATAAYASEQTPTPEKYGFIQFKSDFGEYFHRTSAAIHADLDYPLQREITASVFDLMSLKSIYANVFTSTGSLGSQLTDSNAVQTSESGAQLKFIFTTLGGMIDFSLNTGIVAPWYQQNTIKDPSTTIFIGFGLNTPIM